MPTSAQKPNSTQDLGPELTICYYGGREREQGWGEGKEDKERVEGKPKEETEAKEKGREVQ